MTARRRDGVRRSAVCRAAGCYYSTGRAAEWGAVPRRVLSTYTDLRNKQNRINLAIPRAGRRQIGGLTGRVFPKLGLSCYPIAWGRLGFRPARECSGASIRRIGNAAAGAGWGVGIQTSDWRRVGRVAERAARGGDGAEARRREVIRSRRQGEGKPAVVALRAVGQTSVAPGKLEFIRRDGVPAGWARRARAGGRQAGVGVPAGVAARRNGAPAGTGGGLVGPPSVWSIGWSVDSKHWLGSWWGGLPADGQVVVGGRPAGGG